MITSQEKAIQDAFSSTEDRIITRPPILLRLEDEHTAEETTPQFLGYGWRWGIEHPLVNGIDALVQNVAKTGHSFNVSTEKFLVEKAVTDFGIKPIRVRATQMTSSTYYELEGPIYAALFLPRDFSLFGEQIRCELTGGPSDILLRVLKKIAIRLYCRINTIETAKDGCILVLFMPWNDNETFFDIVPTADGESTNGLVDDTDGSVAGSP